MASLSDSGHEEEAKDEMPRPTTVDERREHFGRSKKPRKSFIDSDPDIGLTFRRQRSDVELSKKGINVFVRFRPDNQDERVRGESCVVYDPDQTTVNVGHNSTNHAFRFKRVMTPDCTQEQTFITTTLPLAEAILDGYNAAVLAYGQTGSGKTHTIFGPGYDRPEHVDRADPEQRGVVPRLLQALFHEMSSNFDSQVYYALSASYIQIYLEKIYDLLIPSKEPLKLYQDTLKGLWLTDATKVPVKNIKEVLNILVLGTKQRVTAATLSNPDSSRSHALLLLTLHKHIENTGMHRASQIYLVDLCGSEKIEKTGATDERLKEAQNINKSLLSLGNIISALSEKKRHIPYRDSKLTRLLQNCFGGNSFTSLILCCSSNSYNAGETLSTLRFGDRASHILNKPIINQVESIEEVKKMLAVANVKISMQQRLIREQNIELMQKDGIIQELYAALENADPRNTRMLKSKYHVNIATNSKNAFCRLGYNTMGRLYSFLDPMDAIDHLIVCRSFYKKLRSEYLWKFYLERLVLGKVTFDGIMKSSVIDPSFAQLREKLEDVECYFSTFVETQRVGWKQKRREMIERAAGSDQLGGKGLRLFPNLAKK